MFETVTFVVEASGDPKVGIDSYYNEITVSRKYEDPEEHEDDAGVTFKEHMKRTIKCWYFDLDGTVKVYEKPKG